MPVTDINEHLHKALGTSLESAVNADGFHTFLLDQSAKNHPNLPWPRSRSESCCTIATDRHSAIPGCAVAIPTLISYLKFKVGSTHLYVPTTFVLSLRGHLGWPGGVGHTTGQTTSSAAPVYHTNELSDVTRGCHNGCLQRVLFALIIQFSQT